MSRRYIKDILAQSKIAISMEPSNFHGMDSFPFSPMFSMEDDDPKGVPHICHPAVYKCQAVGQTLGRVPPVPVGDAELQRGGNVGCVFFG